MSASTRRAMTLASLLPLAWTLVACAHPPPPPPPPEPRPDPQLEEKAKQDLGPDPFREVDAGPPTEVAPAPMLTPAPQKDPRLDDEAAIRATLKGKDCAAIHAALGAHALASPSTVREALTAAERCEEKAGDVRAARPSAEKLLNACGPDGVPRCRSKALALMRRLASRSPKDSALAALAKDVATKDACVAKVEGQVNRDKPLDACLAGAEALYRSHRDELMRARSKLLRARHAVHLNDADADRLFAEASDTCTAARCSALRNQALDGWASWAASQKRTERVLELRLRQDELAASALAPDRRGYVRSPKTDAACAALDDEKSAGACRAFELKSTGHWTFHDWSARDVAGDLPEEQVRRSNDDFSVTLQDCFRAEAQRLPPPSPTTGPASASFKVRWMVTLDGRAAQVHLAPPADDSGPLASCLRERFVAWRYPRSHGENQHVEQGFTVTAMTR